MKSKNGLLGNTSRICCGKVFAVKSLACFEISVPRECSALPKSIDDASKPKDQSVKIPTIAAMATVPIKNIKI